MKHQITFSFEEIKQIVARHALEQNLLGPFEYNSSVVMEFKVHMNSATYDQTHNAGDFIFDLSLVREI